MDTNKRSDTIAKIVIATIMLGLLVWGLALGFIDAGATTFQSPPPGSHLPPRPPIQECQGKHCDEPAPTVTPFISPLRAPARIVSAPTPIQWHSHAPAWPGDFRRTRR